MSARSSKHQEYHSLMLSKVSAALKANTSPPVFDQKKWKGIKAGPYAYVLDIPVSDPQKSFWIPGRISNPDCDTNYIDDIVGRIKQDLKVLGISYREDDETLKAGEWRIAIYSFLDSDNLPVKFRLYREDSDEYWSEKKTWWNSKMIIKYVNHYMSAYSENYKTKYEGNLILKKN